MFYAATQLDDDSNSHSWSISKDACTALLTSLKSYEDETVRYYACKAVENIAAQSSSAGHLLANSATCKLLLDVFLNGEKESFANTGAIALGHLVKINPSLFDYILDIITSTDLCRILTESNARV